MLALLESLRSAIVAEKSSVLILLYLSASDPLATLSSLSIMETVLSWFKSYLSGRFYRVSWRGVKVTSEDTTVPARISACLAHISAWMTDWHLQLILSKSELLVFPASSAVHHNLPPLAPGGGSHQVKSSYDALCYGPSESLSLYFD